MNPSFWHGKRVLVTGHTGFKGAWLSLWLTRLGAQVTGYALPAPTQPSLFELARLGELVDHRLGDVRDLAALQGAFTQARPDIAIHMAAQALVRLSYAEPVGTYATNVLGAVNFLEAVRQQPSVRAALVVTSDKCYQSRDGGQGYREDDPLGGSDPYSSSKACAELVTEAYRRSFLSKPSGAALASVRAGNVIGGGDWAQDRLVPDILAALHRGQAPEIRNPDAVRPWQHVLSPLSGYLTVAERLWQDPAGHAEAWNFGPSQSDEKPVRWIVERLCQGWGGSLAWTGQAGEHPKEAHSLRLDSSKAGQRLGWRPRWDLQQALDAIVAWHRAYESGGDVRDLTLSQIAAYEKA
jgi:CDP-glucose 4,6-dehydratase